MNKFQLIYNKLLKKYGKQGWWPLSKEGLESKHHNGNPETEKDIFEICIGAILTQNTNWNNVEKCIYNLNKKKLIDIEKLKKIKIEKLAQLIRSSGYYNQKAKKIRNFINYIYNKNLKILKNKSTEELREELLNINGIGKETADSIILYAFNKPIFVIDAYTKRIFSKLKICKNNISYDELQKMFMKNLSSDVDLFKEYHALIVRHGKEKTLNTISLRK